MILLDYSKGIHNLSGKDYQVINDIVITPFWTEEFCLNLVEVATFYSSYFKREINFLYENGQNLGWHDLKLDKISPILFLEYTKHYKRDIIPILENVYSKESAFILGWFSPFILRYNEKGQSSSLHNDSSHFTLNIKLNNDYTGSELKFPRQNFSNKDVPIGYAIIWPSTITHPHLATPLESGVKYSFSSFTWPLVWQSNGIENS